MHVFAGRRLGDLARPTGAARPSGILFNIGTLKHPQTTIRPAEAFTFELARRGQLTHAAHGNAENGGDFLHIHQITFSHEIECNIVLIAQ